MELNAEVENKIENARRNIESILVFSELKSARKLSLILGQEQRYMARVISGVRELSLPIVLKITKIFNLDLDLLFRNPAGFNNFFKIDKKHIDEDKISTLKESAKNAWKEYQNKQ